MNIEVIWLSIDLFLEKYKEKYWKGRQRMVLMQTPTQSRYQGHKTHEKQQKGLN